MEIWSSQKKNGKDLVVGSLSLSLPVCNPHWMSQPRSQQDHVLCRLLFSGNSSRRSATCPPRNRSQMALHIVTNQKKAGQFVPCMPAGFQKSEQIPTLWVMDGLPTGVQTAAKHWQCSNCDHEVWKKLNSLPTFAFFSRFSAELPEKCTKRSLHHHCVVHQWWRSAPPAPLCALFAPCCAFFEGFF